MTRHGGRLPDPGLAAICARCGEPREAHGGTRHLGACPGESGLYARRFQLREEDKAREDEDVEQWRQSRTPASRARLTGASRSDKEISMEQSTRTQRNDSMTLADLKAWMSGATIDDDLESAAFYSSVPRIATRIFPDCPGCGGYVHPDSGAGAALTVDAVARTATFRPCGCVLSVPDMPEWSPAE